MVGLSEVVVIGCGFVGREVARQALAAGRSVLVTTRDPVRADALRAEGLSVHLLDRPEAWDALSERAAGAACVVTYPPDSDSDRRMAEAGRRFRALVYISSTAVYGDATGVVDDTSPAVPNSERGLRRLTSERCLLDVGAVVLRAPGIYGPGRGVHLRLRAGTFRLVEDGSAYLSRIHVYDLAGLALAALERGHPGAVHVVGDLHPSSQRELVAFLCERLGLPMPERVARAEVHETLRGDRRVDPRPALAALGYDLRFPGYHEGYGEAVDQLIGTADLDV